jgi:hypothetical protein
MDYFAVSFPDLLIWDEDLAERNRMNCTYLKALGLLGQGKAREASALLDTVIATDPSHAGAVVHRRSALAL